jgi:hypothetical protein
MLQLHLSTAELAGKAQFSVVAAATPPAAVVAPRSAARRFITRRAAAGSTDHQQQQQQQQEPWQLGSYYTKKLSRNTDALGNIIQV